MEALTRLVTDSLARYGLDRPVDPRRLQWSRWFRCDSPHSLLVVPSKPGIFAIAEEIADFGPGTERERGSFQGTASAVSEPPRETAALATEIISKRMLAVLQFSEDDNMAYVLDRMFAHANPMRSRLQSGNCFVRFVVVEDQPQRRSICAALNQWMRNSAEKASGFPAEFLSSLELPNVAEKSRVGRTVLSANPEATTPCGRPDSRGTETNLNAISLIAPAHPDSGANRNLHCAQPFPSGF